jgi:hypothetical protein
MNNLKKFENRSPTFSSLIENILENTLANIMSEAFQKEFSLTNRPRLIALPPKLVCGNTAVSIPSRATTSNANQSKSNKEVSGGSESVMSLGSQKSTDRTSERGD